jgi:hypothetical protein
VKRAFYVFSLKSRELVSGHCRSETVSDTEVYVDRCYAPEDHKLDDRDNVCELRKSWLRNSGNKYRSVLRFWT